MIQGLGLSTLLKHSNSLHLLMVDTSGGKSAMFQRPKISQSFPNVLPLSHDLENLCKEVGPSVGIPCNDGIMHHRVSCHQKFVDST
jgi:hypothetical protein